MKFLVPVSVFLLISSAAFAQGVYRRPDLFSRDQNLATPIGQTLAISVTSYTYDEPGDLAISIHGSKLGVSYTNTRALGGRRRQRWFAQLDGRGVFGTTTYDGWCSPFIIVPESSSPNGYALETGAASPCSESGDRDWYVEGRLLAGKDFVGARWGVSPIAGVGLRHLSNGATGTPGYRTDDYLYLPIGLTARTRQGAHGTLSMTAEYDRLLHGWQTTHDSALGGGDVPATPTAPAFTIDGFTDIAFDQSTGWALRASVRYQPGRQWFLEPYYIRWSIGDSPIADETATFTVNGISAQQQIRAYEPHNITNELGIRLGLGL
jgi:hypothetical protein